MSRKDPGCGVFLVLLAFIVITWLVLAGLLHVTVR